jgi:hypothetical protein
MEMAYALLAHGVVLIHLAFVLFVALGALLVLRWRGWAWVHSPCVLWGAWVELAGWVCPLTPIENRFRELAGLGPYGGDFVGRYLLPVLYPSGLTRGAQVTLGALLVLLNAALYLWAFRGGRCSVRQST